VFLCKRMLVRAVCGCKGSGFLCHYQIFLQLFFFVNPIRGTHKVLPTGGTAYFVVQLPCLIVDVWAVVVEVEHDG